MIASTNVKSEIINKLYINTTLIYKFYKNHRNKYYKKNKFLFIKLMMSKIKNFTLILNNSINF